MIWLCVVLTTFHLPEKFVRVDILVIPGGYFLQPPVRTIQDILMVTATQHTGTPSTNDNFQ